VSINMIISMVFLTRAQNERRVVELYGQDRTYREIAKEVHISLGDICSIIRRHTGEDKAEAESGQQHAETVDKRAFKLFEEGKTPVQVVISLNIQSDEISRLYKEWQQLKGLHGLNQIYEERKSDLAEFHAAYKLMKAEGVSPRVLVDAANCLEQLSSLEARLKNLKHDIQGKENQKQAQMNELSLLRNDITLALQEVDSYTPSINANKEEIAKLIHQVQELESLITKLKNTGEYRKIEKVAEAVAKKILRDNKMILEIALGAVIQALKDDPGLQLVISGPLRDPTYGARSGIAIRNYLINYNTTILEMSGQIFNDILGRCVSNTMSSALSMT